MNLRPSIVGLLVLVVSACAASSDSPADAPRGASPFTLGPDFALDPGDEPVVARDVALARTYYQIVRSKAGTHYLLPRPDGTPVLAARCAAKDTFAGELAAHDLCASAPSPEAVARVNGLDERLAQSVSTVLHAALRFRREGDTIVPFPLTRDLNVLCAADTPLARGPLQARCADERRYAEIGARPSSFRAFTEAELDALPEALNALYGIPANLPVHAQP
jgi:hypothetical protein